MHRGRSGGGGASVAAVRTLSPPSLPDRHPAIDVMRGLTLALMIVVNMSLSETEAYAPLLHAAWHGLTLTDLVFPSFLFVVGTAMAFTQERHATQCHGPFLRKVLRRTLLIFLCGWLLYWFPFFTHDASGALVLKPLSGTRIPGVLQRIALCYGLAALVVHFGGVRAAWVCGVAALLGHWAVTAAFGDLTMAGSAALKLDLWLLGANHLYQGEGMPFDPEGVLGTLSALPNVLAGWLAGRWLRERGSTHEAVARLWLAAALAVTVALAWQAFLPFNKKLWTSSYTLVTAGISVALLAFLVDRIQLHGWRRGTHFFEVFGRNTLFLYLSAEVGMAVLWLTEVQGRSTMRWIYETALLPWAGGKPGGLLLALAYTGVIWALGWVMDRRRIYIRL